MEKKIIGPITYEAEPEQSAEGVAFNLAVGLIEEIRGLLMSASHGFINRDLRKGATSLFAIRYRIVGDLTKAQRIKFSTMEDQLTTTFYLQEKLKQKPLFAICDHKPISETRINKIKKELKKTQPLTHQYRAYNEFLMDCLKQYGYLIPQKKNQEKLLE